MPLARAYGASGPTSPLARLDIARREPLPTDVELEILYCGVCHSDLHTVRSEWEGTNYPCVPGHEIVGRVTRVGASVKGFTVGKLAAVGVMVDACRTCPSCREGLEQYCEKDPTFTYNSPDLHKTAPFTYGGYSSRIVVDQAFCLRVSDTLPSAAVAPLLCAGITLYSPLKHWQAGPGRKVGIVGLGGLGHMGVKFSHALGAHTVLFTTSPSKAQDARRLGADEVVLSRNATEMAAHKGTFDLIIDTVSASHDLDAYLELLKRDATLVLVGLPEHANAAPSAGKLIVKRRRLAGSMVGGLQETQEMLDFCAKHRIVSEIELVRIQDIERAYERMLKSDVRYRFVIDMASLI